jgi:NADH dehydrogenase (ubiquinone) 1 alpha subcomplex subunit 5
MQSSLLKTLATALPSLRWQFGAAITTRSFSKATTGIVGLPVDEQARQNLGEKLQEVLAAVSDIPADAEYRRSIEATVNAKLKALNSDASDAALEEQFGRQLEQEIKLCKEELKLVVKMKEWEPWNVPAGYTVEILEEKDVEAKVSGGPAPGAPPPPPAK